MPRYLKLTTLFLLSVSLFFSIGYASEGKPPREEIDRLIRRGQEIANYERVIIKATDLLLASRPDRSKLEVYIAVKDSIRWFIYFGRISENGDSFETYCSYSCPHGLLEKMREVEDEKVVSTDVLQLAKAVKLTRDSAISQSAKVPAYNTNVFREDDGSITVYLTPGTENPEVILLGGDYKVSISADGSRILNIIQLHNGILEFPLNAEDGMGLAGAYHTHVLNNLPTETDVAFILLNPQLAPHYIMGQNWMSRIDADGTITILGKTEDVLDVEETNGQKKTR